MTINKNTNNTGSVRTEPYVENKDRGSDQSAATNYGGAGDNPWEDSSGVDGGANAYADIAVASAKHGSTRLTGTLVPYAPMPGEPGWKGP